MIAVAMILSPEGGNAGVLIKSLCFGILIQGLEFRAKAFWDGHGHKVQLQMFDVRVPDSPSTYREVISRAHHECDDGYLP